MQLRWMSVLLALCAGCATVACAESKDCSAPVLIIPDGRLTASTFPQNTTYWYGIYAQAGHSYSVEFEPPADNYLNTLRPQFQPLGVFGPSDSLLGCTGSSSVAVTQNSGYAPTIFKNSNGAGRRVSFTAQGSGLYLIYASNLMGAGAYTFRAVDTTLFNPRWNTNSGSDTQWGLVNWSEMTVTGTLTAFDGNGRVLCAAQITIPPSGRVTRFAATDLNVPRNMAGSATFSHNGPPDAVLADAVVTSSTGLPPILVKFESLAPR